MGNLGLLDRTIVQFSCVSVSIPTHPHVEREALKWVQKYISAFGGDPSKVMMYVPGAYSQHSADVDFLR